TGRERARVKPRPTRDLFGFAVGRSFQTPLARRGGERVDQSSAVFPANTGVGDALAVGQRFSRDQILAPGFQMALDHDAEDARVAAGDLRRDVVPDGDLFEGILAAVVVAAVDHDARGNPRFGEILGRGVDVGGVVVGLFPPAQNDVAVLVAAGRYDRRVAGLGDGKKMMRRLGRADRVHGNAHVAVGAVLETDRAGETRGELAVHLALGGARANGAPG